MAESSTDLRARLQAALGSDLDRGALLRELETLAQEPGFEDCADLWAPALYQRDAYFFETFLLRHLRDEQAAVIQSLLPRIEAAGNDTLFAGLYRRVAREPAWNAELLALARSAGSDQDVLRAVQRRNMQRMGYVLSEETALALYARNPALFRAFIQEHVHRRWRSDHGSFPQLREAARRQGDDELYWGLFRELADPEEWEAVLHELLRQDMPAGAIVAELRKRQRDYVWDLDAGILAGFLAKYGAAVMPYIEENLYWIVRSAGSRLLSAAERAGDEALYWRIFFHAGDQAGWNRALRELLAQQLADEALLQALRLRTPSSGRARLWQLDDTLALALYRRNPRLFRPFLERCLGDPDLALFQEAERAGDEEFLDFLTARLVRQSSLLVLRGYSPIWAEQRVGKQARQELEMIGQALTARFDRLYAQSPAEYVRHAASALGYFEPLESWSFRRDMEHNPGFAYLYREHREAWRQSLEGVRELLESPNIYVQVIGLAALAEGGADAAQRTIENLVSLRAVLLSRDRRSTKRLALACLYQAGRQSAELAEQILPVLEEVLYYRGERAIDEPVMVSYVRLRRLWAAERPAAPAPQTA
jgi:hypothetical protein